MKTRLWIPALFSLCALAVSACGDDELDELDAAELELSDEELEMNELAALDGEDETTATGGKGKGKGKPNPCAVVKCGFGTVCEVVKGQATCVEPEPDPCLATTCLEGTVCEVQNNGKAACVPVEGEPCGAVTCGDGLVCCNASCGICTPPDGACIQIVCE